jgi:rhamnogalacturonan acetylesterase
LITVSALALLWFHLVKLFLKTLALTVLLLVGLADAFSQQPEKPRLVLIGDSTVKNGQGRGDGGLWGWGQVISQHFDLGRIDIENQAIGGRSSRTFLTEGRWDRAIF